MLAVRTNLMQARSGSCWGWQQSNAGFEVMRLAVRCALLFLFAVCVAAVEAQEAAKAHPGEFNRWNPRYFLTNSSSFATLTEKDYQGGCAFRLTGLVTLVDSNRNLMVLQDAAGALALHFGLEDQVLQVGQHVTVECSNCYPYLVSLPNYPYRPTGWEIQDAFEAPTDWGDYHLQRMRGFLHPPVSGQYTLWIASDNSSELWLSPDEDPSRSRRIALIPSYGYLGRRAWSSVKYKNSQRSDPIYLEAGRAYYIEALQEQTTGGDNLSVAWQSPQLAQSLITGAYLTPWRRSSDSNRSMPTNGILREYWTNFSSGSLSVLGAPRPFESAVSAEKVTVTVHGRGTVPEPKPIILNQRLTPDYNYRWVDAEGQVTFVGVDGDVACLELADGQSQIQVRALHWDRRLLQDIRKSTVRIAGVCEAVHDQTGNLVPGLIWATMTNSISFTETVRTNLGFPTGEASRVVINSPSPPLEGFYLSRGVVTFNDRVFDKDYLFVQEGTASVFVSLKDRHYKNDLKVGQWIELAGALQPRKFVPVISPLGMTELGWRSLPAPIAEPIQFPVPENFDGRWTEFQGVAHVVNSNGTISLMGRSGALSIWIGQTPTNNLNRYVDAKLRVRGVLSLAAPEAPLLLIPSRGFVDVEEEAPQDPFGIPPRPIADLNPEAADASALHRVRVFGEVTYRDAQSFVIQDTSGSVHVQALDAPDIKVGDGAEVAGFPAPGSPGRVITEALVRPARLDKSLEPALLDLNEAFSFKESGKLVRVSAVLLNQRTFAGMQILELQERQRIFAATLWTSNGALPAIAPGSRVKVTGVCDNEPIVLPATGKTTAERPSAGSLNIWLRTPADLVVLRGPPWWTLRRTVALVSALLTVSAVALLWVYLLRRRLDRQRAARLAFSRQILQSQESERQRIALNLHDSLGQNLLVIKNQARLAMQATTDETMRQQRLSEVCEITTQAIEEVRQITHDLRPYQLDRLGLTQAIRATVKRASENSSILFASHVDDVDSVFDKASEIHVYRVVQEAINNVVKHSAATEAAVVVKKEDGRVSLSIRDNGRGFESGPDASRAHNRGYGLSGIRERVGILGGNVTIESAPDQGTILAVEIPTRVLKP